MLICWITIYAEIQISKGVISIPILHNVLQVQLYKLFNISELSKTSLVWVKIFVILSLLGC